jgi:hypothetical protein
MSQRKPDPIKHCLWCGKLMHRKRLHNGDLEGYQPFLRKLYCSKECREERADNNRIIHQRMKEQQRKDRILSRNNIYDRYQITRLDNECMIVTNVKPRRNGYYEVYYKGKAHGLHRVVYMLFKGEIPKGKCICHKCNNSLCINPDHLYAGSRKDNTQDMIKSNRYYKWSGNKRKLSDNDIINIRNSPLSSYELAEIYPVTPTHIRRIRAGTRCRTINNDNKGL